MSSLRSLVEILRAGPNNSMNEAFRTSSFGTQIRVDITIGGSTLHFSEGPVLDDGDGLTKSKDAVYPPADQEVIKLSLTFLSGLLW